MPVSEQDELPETTGNTQTTKARTLRMAFLTGLGTLYVTSVLLCGIDALTAHGPCMVDEAYGYTPDRCLSIERARSFLWLPPVYLEERLRPLRFVSAQEVEEHWHNHQLTNGEAITELRRLGLSSSDAEGVIYHDR